MTEILTPISTDHSPVLLCFSKKIFLDSVSEARENGHLSTSQKQATIRLIEKKG